MHDTQQLVMIRNTWVNEAFKKSGLKACLWTPFDFILIEKHKSHLKE
jgi:hypothetical protein